MHTLARFVTSAHKYIIFAWIAIFVVLTFFAIKLPGLLEGDGFKIDGEHAAVMDIVSDEFGMPAETMFLVFDNVPDDKIESTLIKVDKLKVTSEIVSPLDNDTQYKEGVSYALLHFDNQDKDMSAIVTDIREAVGNEKGITLTGASAISKDINTASQRDLMTAEAIGLPIAIIILLFAFGTVVASFVPLIIGIVTVVSSFGVLAILGGKMDLSIFVLNIIPMLGLALSIDFALLFISRYREERKKSDMTRSYLHYDSNSRKIRHLFRLLCVHRTRRNDAYPGRNFPEHRNRWNDCRRDGCSRIYYPVTVRTYRSW